MARTLNKIEQFQVFCLENYKTTNRLTGAEALNEFKQHDVFDFLESGYEVLHTQSKEYIVSEIIEYIAQKK